MSESQSETQAVAPTWLDHYFRAEARVLTLLAYFCGTIFLFYSFYVALEVIGRNFVGIFTGVTDEIGGYALAFGGSVGLAYTLRAQGHVRIDIIFSFLSPRARPWFDAVAMATMAVFAAVVGYYMYEMVVLSKQIGATGHSLIGMPQWIIQSMVLLGYGMLCFTAITGFIASVLTGLGLGRPALPEKQESTAV
jgi:TRAP-type mannitol/chloroaromatic compound transport system permease small subunit